MTREHSPASHSPAQDGRSAGGATPDPVAVGTGPLTEGEVLAVARFGAQVMIAPESVIALERARAVIDALAADTEPHYGISTGFGALATKHIPPERRAQLQRSLIRSHAAGSGPEVEREVVRAMMLLRLSTLTTGHTGVRPATAQALADLLNLGLTPVVHEFGSLGCSGDLAPLAHVALALIGEGHVRDANGELLPAARALAAHRLEPIELAEKEGLALINGTDGMLGQLLLACADLQQLADDAGVDSGHMIAQYTQAAIVSELKRLAVPASVDSIPSSAMQEDHVSMGWSAARKLRRSVDGLTRVLAIELLTAARALDLRAPLQPGVASRAVVAALRQRTPGPGPDRFLAPEIEAAVQLVRSGAVVAAAQAALGTRLG